MDIRNSIANWKLYIITDEELSKGRSHFEIARAAIAGSADVIQLRDKKTESLKLYQSALEIRALTRGTGIPFIMNDRLDIALAADTDGLHVGQDDLPAKIARKLLGPHKILGVSVSSEEEAVQAEKEGADYLGVGPIFEARGTKADAGEPRGLQLIKSIHKKCRLPIVAIGGINQSNVKRVIDAGAQCVAIISAVVSASDIAEATRQLKDQIGKSGGGNTHE